MSIESRLLEPRANSISCRNGGDCSEGNTDEDSEVGTQLNELMNLCSEVDAQGDMNREASVLERSNLDVAASELLWSDRVECPLCGLDISDLSEEQRQIHTNDCLDKDGTSGVD